MNADPGWPAQPSSTMDHYDVGEFVAFTDGSKRRLLKLERTLTSNRPGDSGANHESVTTTYLFEPNEQRWLK